ncbi:MAG: DUF192 domain-containing protein [Myxococcota bacterium]
MLRTPRAWLFTLIALGLTAACAAAEERSEVVWVSLGGETFSLELALDASSRYEGLSGRGVIPRRGGMLFVLPHPQPFAMVMRDCPAPIDVAFVDAGGSVVAIHEMKPEAPRRPDESRSAYEARLPMYPSRALVQFAIEVGGGRLREVGVEVGDRIPLDLEGLVARAR